jgi:iron complex outermembrane recepter protein
MRLTTKAVMASGAAMLLPFPAFAQDSEAARSSNALEEIVVTAQRRAETLTSVPLSITALSGETLDSTGITTISDLKFQTPGFLSQSGTGYTQLFIRGIGNIIYVGADPSVATFIDDVPRPYGSLVDNFINVERVEVLKGAQGGLYGRNATGGVVNIITRQPGDKFEMRGRISVAEYDSVEASAYVNAPLGENVAANFSAMRRVHDPYLENQAVLNPYPPGTSSFFGDPNSVIRRGELNNADFYALDGKLRFDFSDNFKLTLSGDYSKKADGDGNGWVQKNLPLNYLVYRGLAMQAGISNPVGPWPASERDTAYDAVGSYSNTEDYGGSARAELALDHVDLISITAFRWNNSNFRGDIGGAPVPMAGFETDFDRNNFYQELRAVSSGDGPFRYLGGVTYYEDTIDSLIYTVFTGFNLPGPTTSHTKTKNWSIYGELSYDITDRLTLTGSLRYVSEKKDLHFPAQGGFGATDASTKQDEPLPSVTISYDIGDGILYARYARGFKTGGVNPIVMPQAFGDAPGSEFGPETVDAFEAGFRANLFDRQVQFTSAIFYNDYSGLQIARAGNAANPQVTNAILNAGTARTYGAEASVTWRVNSAITFNGNIGYLNARYKDASYPGSPVVDPFTADGNRMALAPEWQGSASIAIDTPVSESYRFVGNALYAYVSSYNHQYEEDPLLEQPAYSLVNLRAGFATTNDEFGAYLFVNNLFDKYYTIWATKNSLGVLTTQAPPRVIGGTLEFKF